YLDKMSAKFRNWSETVGKSEGFRKFIDYVQKNGPVIMQLIGNIVNLLVTFGTAMAPIASALLNVVTKVIGFTAALMGNHTWIARLIGISAILLGTLWSLAVPLMAVNSFLGLFGTSLLGLTQKFVTSGNASKIFTGIINILKGAIGFLLNPIGNIVKLLPLLGTAF
ncbi:terminase, partial [Staphylococcus sp. 231237_7MaSpsaltlick]